MFHCRAYAICSGAARGGWRFLPWLWRNQCNTNPVLRMKGMTLFDRLTWCAFTNRKIEAWCLEQVGGTLMPGLHAGHGARMIRRRGRCMGTPRPLATTSLNYVITEAYFQCSLCHPHYKNLGPVSPDASIGIKVAVGWHMATDDCTSRSGQVLCTAGSVRLNPGGTKGPRNGCWRKRSSSCAKRCGNACLAGQPNCSRLTAPAGTKIDEVRLASDRQCRKNLAPLTVQKRLRFMT